MNSNYGKNETEKKIKAANSKTSKYTTRICLTFLKTCFQWDIIKEHVLHQFQDRNKALK